MKIKIEKSDLLNGINIVLKAVKSGAGADNMPILKCILLNASDKGLQLTGNNLEMGIETTNIEADVEEQGSVALEAKLFSDIIKILPNDYVYISVDKKHKTTFKCGKSKFNILGLDPVDFPEMPVVEQRTGFSISESILRKMIQSTVFATTEEGGRPICAGELIKVEDNTVSLVASDGFRIAKYCYESGMKEQTSEAVVPGKYMSEVAKISSGTDEQIVKVYLSDNHILFEFGTCTVISRLLSGEFFNYEGAFNIDELTAAKVNKNDLILSLEKICLIAIESNKRNYVKFEIKNNSISISANAGKGAVFDVIEADTDGEPLTIRFNPKFFLEILKAINDKEIRMQYAGARAPCVITPSEDNGDKYLILPARPEAS